MALTTGKLKIRAVDVGTEVNNKVPISGNRGDLAGYESTATLTSSSTTITNSSRDSIVWNSTGTITVANGTSGQAWIKVVMLQQVPTSVTLGSNWGWVGGSVPTLTANGILVLGWNGVKGVANFLGVS